MGAQSFCWFYWLGKLRDAEQLSWLVTELSTRTEQPINIFIISPVLRVHNDASGVVQPGIHQRSSHGAVIAHHIDSIIFTVGPEDVFKQPVDSYAISV